MLRTKAMDRDMLGPDGRRLRPRHRRQAGGDDGETAQQCRQEAQAIHGAMVPEEAAVCQSPDRDDCQFLPAT
jgi:hypothetical protein